jgi:hypothetical protein
MRRAGAKLSDSPFAYFSTDRAGKLTEEWDSVIPIPADAPYRILLIQPDRFVFTSDYEATYNPPPEIQWLVSRNMPW